MHSRGKISSIFVLMQRFLCCITCGAIGRKFRVLVHNLRMYPLIMRYLMVTTDSGADILCVLYAVTGSSAAFAY